MGETASQMLNRGDDEVESSLLDRKTSFTDKISPTNQHKWQTAWQMRKDEPSQMTDEYMNKKTGTSNKKGRDDLNNL